MKQIVLAGHGNFASGLYSAAKIILGEQNFVTYLDCYVDDKQDVENDIKHIIESFGEEDEIIFLTDVFGGSVNNTIMKLMELRDLKLITGINLNLLLSLILNIDMELEELIKISIKESKNGLINCNQIIENDMEEDDF